MMVACSLCFQGFVAFTGLQFGNRASRATIFFNNPNQLGYWSLLSMSILALAVTKLKLPMWLVVAAFVCAPLITFLSLSKAAIAGIVCLFILIGLRKPIIVIAALVVMGTFVSTPTGQNYIEGVQRRFASIGQQDDDSLEGRFYDRIIDNPQYWVFGAGEGAYDRFTTIEDKLKEIHSSFGAVFFSYGFVGFVLFFAALAMMFGKSVTAWAYAVPVAMYSITHNGLRFTSFWLFLAFVFCFFEWIREGAPARSAVEPEEDELEPEPLLDPQLAFRN
jgi:hypothetical protein